MSSYWLINAQKLNQYVLFDQKASPCDYKYEIVEGWYLDSIGFKGLRKDEKCISALLNEKQTSYKYVDSLIQIANLPEIFAYIPLVLSGYQSTHVSDIGGVGIWSLNYLTALRQGLIMNKDLDERKNDRLSTEGSLKELNRLWGMYKDEKWTILAFITSPSYVSNIRNSSNTNNWEEAKIYLEEKYLNAIDFCNLLDKLYFKNPLQEITPTKKVVQYVFTKTMTFNAIYDYKDVDFSIIEKENPVLVNQTIPKEYKINLSPEIGDFLSIYQDSIALYQDSIWNNSFYLEDKLSLKYHRVKKGDVLGRIAQEHNVTIKQIMEWNNLENSRIYIDQKLKLFAADNINNDEYLIYQVQLNDSYWEIAQRFPNIRVKDLLAYNRFQFLKPKDKLRIIKK